MDEGLENEIKEIKELTEENNKMLHSIQRRARWTIVMRLMYWIFIVGASIGAFYFIQPYLNQLNDTYDSIKTTQQKASDFSQNFSIDSIKEYLGGL